MVVAADVKVKEPKLKEPKLKEPKVGWLDCAVACTACVLCVTRCARR